MPEKGVNLKKKKGNKKKTLEKEGEDGQEKAGVDDEHDIENEEDQDDDKADIEEAKKESAGPPQESVGKLEKLEPLPPLLGQDFDLDMHVGLIQRLLAQDAELVKMQSTLSGGGEREKVFWHNYFFHCAFTRYEAGLSIDEIWSEENNSQAPPTTTEAAAAAAAAAEPSSTAADGSTTDDTASGSEQEQTITFTSEAEGTSTPSDKAFHAEPATDPSAPFSPDATSAADAAASAAKDGSENNGSKDSSDFELVGGADGGNDDDDDGAGNAASGDALAVDEEVVDYELDELEEEIARELEDM